MKLIKDRKATVCRFAGRVYKRTYNVPTNLLHCLSSHLRVSDVKLTAEGLAVVVAVQGKLVCCGDASQHCKCHKNYRLTICDASHQKSSICLRVATGYSGRNVANIFIAPQPPSASCTFLESGSVPLHDITHNSSSPNGTSEIFDNLKCDENGGRSVCSSLSACLADVTSDDTYFEFDDKWSSMKEACL